jgi:hypothetical protein
MPDINVLVVPNPDSISISNKDTVDISFTTTDVSASYYSSSIQPNYAASGVSVVIPRQNSTVERGNIYYTPIYTEKLSYQEWKSRINKNFLELT